MLTLAKRLIFSSPVIKKIAILVYYRIWTLYNSFILHKRIKKGAFFRDLNIAEVENWNIRIKKALSSPESDLIPRVLDAGTIRKNNFIMHNGIKIKPLTYYGYPMLKLLMESKGVAEPQETLILNQIIKSLSQDAVMVELGSYWSFYSLSFKQFIKKGNCFLVEPNLFFLESGKCNFKANNQRGYFINAFIGEKKISGRPGTTTIDDLIFQYNIKYIDLLHSDIQGAEVAMLKGASHAMEFNKIGYVLISTHSDQLHSSCTEILKHNKFKIMHSIGLEKSYSGDGLIVACSYHKLDNN